MTGDAQRALLRREIEDACNPAKPEKVRHNAWKGAVESYSGVFNLPDADGNTPAHELVSRVIDIEFLSMAARNGMDFNIANRSGEQPIHHAAFRWGPDGTCRIISWLCRNGRADVNAGTGIGCTPLHLACMRKDPDRVAVLIDAGSDVGALTSGGWAPLHLAALRSTGPVVRRLLAGGADPAAKNGEGRTAREIAILNGNSEVCDDPGALEPLKQRRCTTITTSRLVQYRS